MNNQIAIIGEGRLGGALARSLRAAGAAVSGPHGRGFRGDGSGIVLACVPDEAIAEAAALVEPGPVLGHCSGACPVSRLGDRPAFGMHPLMTFPGGEANLDGVWCAVAGTGPAERQEAERLARLVGMRPFALEEADRAAYHAAASMASNFFVTLQADARALADRAGIPPEVLAPLVRATLDNLERVGPEEALTGPIARDDQGTVDLQRQAIAGSAPELVALFDVLAERTRELALDGQGAAA